MERMEFRGRLVYSITSEEGQKDYYEHLNRWHVAYHNNNLLVIPTKDEAQEFLRLKLEESKLILSNDIEDRKKYLRLESYKTKFDWRPQKSSERGLVGLVSPTGEQLLPSAFADVFTQFDAINKKPDFIPLSNGETWALVSLSAPPVLINDFKYNAIIPERWGQRLFFVQDKDSKKWGVLKVTYPFLKDKCGLPLVKTLMPPIADEIYEDELMTEESPTTFFMTRLGDKIGILTEFGYSDIIYDSYDVDDEKCSLRLIRNDRKRTHHADYWKPERKGKHYDL